MHMLGLSGALGISFQAACNRDEAAGFIAAHPTEGVFAGVDRQDRPVFIPLEDLASAQPVPVFFHPALVPTQACSDFKILECKIFRVHVSNVEKRETSGKDIIDPVTRGIKIKTDGNAQAIHDLSSGFMDKAAMKFDRAMIFSRPEKYRDYRHTITRP